jgi:hypothetical protein
VWNQNRGARLVWVEALDGGDPRRDGSASRPLDAARRAVHGAKPTSSTASNIAPAACRGCATPTISSCATTIATGAGTRLCYSSPARDKPRATLDDRSTRDRYNDPGAILSETTAHGRRIVRERGAWIFRVGQGETAAGPRPFLDRTNLVTLERERLFESGSRRSNRPRR